MKFVDFAAIGLIACFGRDSMGQNFGRRDPTFRLGGGPSASTLAGNWGFNPWTPRPTIGQIPNTSLPPGAGIPVVIPTQPIAEVPPDTALVVDVDPRIPGDRAKLHSKASMILGNAKLQPPQERIAYFRSISYDPANFKGWHAYVERIDLVGGGMIASLRVTAKSKQSIDTACYYEKHFINNQGISFLFGQEPIGQIRLMFH